MKNLRQILRFIFSHPLTKNNKISACLRFLKWQIGTRFFPFPVLWPFVETSKLLVKRGMSGATGNIYTGLHEFEEMSFLLHLLRPEDIFVDVGANVGSYTILASSVIGAKSISFEPLPSTFLHLKHNVAVNNIEARVELHNCGIGEEKGKLSFTSGFDTMNHVVADPSDLISETVQVDIFTLDDILAARIPILMKIDTEGFEMAVLHGAGSVLRHSALLAIIVELNGCCHRYGINEQDIHDLILSHGFIPVAYNPFGRSYIIRNSFILGGNTIYIRDEANVKKRLHAARKFRVLKQDV